MRRSPILAARFLVGLALGLLGGTGAAYAEWPTIATEAKQAILIDFQTGAVLLNKNADELMPPSSMSKLMTGYMVFDKLKKGELKLEDELPVSEKAWKTFGSKMFVPLGERVKVADLLRGMIIQSGNDACIVLAEGLAGSEEKFAELMTQKAREIGMPKSVFRNAHGLPDPQHVMTARELAHLASLIIRNFPDFYGLYSEKTFTYGIDQVTKKPITQGNRNPLLYKNVGADGLKTGHTDAAGYGLTASTMRDGRRLILVINGMQNVNARAREAERLLDWGYREFETVTIAKAGQPVDEANVWLGVAPKVGLASDVNISATMPRPARKSLKVVVQYDDPIPAPIRRGQPIGRLVVSASEMETKEYPLVTAGDVAKLGFADRIATAASYLVWGRPAAAR
ncbi:D-alanyl-D-alanine carboxypeptidase family protein [Desertibaculum subflavum]|uniref:D-alanyl-D-alanine carboxypeptidase family protein n=1 Tax=Desertibaculum subflavum TaxID=2268458 RepID=UPI000E66A5DC